MATCKDCLHYDICIFHLKGNENENCVHFKNTADVAPRSEVEVLMASKMLKEAEIETLKNALKISKIAAAREVFEEIDGITDLFAKGLIGELEMYDQLDELKKKYTEGE